MKGFSARHVIIEPESEGQLTGWPEFALSRPRDTVLSGAGKWQTARAIPETARGIVIAPSSPVRKIRVRDAEGRFATILYEGQVLRIPAGASWPLQVASAGNHSGNVELLVAECEADLCLLPRHEAKTNRFYLVW